MASLHEYAVKAEQNLEKLATGLAQSGVDQQTVTAVSKMADVTRQLVVALGKGQEQTGDNEAPADEAAPAPEQQPAQPQGGHTMDSATADLHKQTVAQAQQPGQ